MANSNENESIIKESKLIKKEPVLDSNKSSTKPKLNAPPKNKNHFSLGTLALATAILAIIFTLFTMQNNNKNQKNLADEYTHLSSELNKLKQSQTTIQNQTDAKSSGLQQTQNTLQKKMEDFSRQLQIAMEQKLFQNQDWILLKARYYLELAQINAHWSDNFNAAISLLQQADKLIEQMSTSITADIRQAIAKEIAQLQAINPVYIAGLLSRLDAAQVMVDKLTTPFSKAEKQLAPVSTVSASSWKSQVEESFTSLKKLRVIRRNEEQISPLISPLYESALRQSLRLYLQEAQWAVLNRNPTVYQWALEQTAKNLKKTFNDAEYNTKILLQQINELQGIKITQEKPLMGQALPLINQIINNKEANIMPTHSEQKGGAQK